MNNSNDVNALKQKYPTGTKIRLVKMNNCQAVPQGAIGVVKFVDDRGTIHMKWDNNSELGLIEGVDEFQIMETEMFYESKAIAPFTTKAKLNRNTEQMFLNDVSIDKEIILSDFNYQYFKNHLNEEYNFIREYRNILSKRNDTFPCLLIRGETSSDAMIVQSNESNSIENYSYISDVKSLLMKMHRGLNENIIQVSFVRKEAKLDVEPSKVEKIIRLTEQDFNYFSKNMLNDYKFINDHQQLMYEDKNGIQHCLLVIGDEHDEGILIQSEGFSYARYWALLPNANLWIEQQYLSDMIENQWDIEKLKEDRIRVLIVEPDQAPKLSVIDNTLESLQKIVGGYIESVWLSDSASLILNEEGKIENLPPNRRLDQDIIVGTFLIVGTNDSEYLCSLCDEDVEKYQEEFKEIEHLTMEDLK